MKKLLSLISIVFFLGCGSNPTPSPIPPSPSPVPVPPAPIPTPIPVPPPIIAFEVLGKKINIQAEMKSNAKVSLEEMRSALRATVAQLEGLAIKK